MDIDAVMEGRRMRMPTMWCVPGIALLAACDKDPTGPTFPDDSGSLSPDAIVGSPVQCEGGLAAGFSCLGVDLMSFLPLVDLGGGAGVPAFSGDPGSGVTLNDMWGWTDSRSGIEYALVGRSDGVAFVSLADPERPVYVGQLPKTTGSSSSL